MIRKIGVVVYAVVSIVSLCLMLSHGYSWMALLVFSTITLFLLRD